MHGRQNEGQNEPAFVLVWSHNYAMVSQNRCDASVDALVSAGEGRKDDGKSDADEG